MSPELRAQLAMARGGNYFDVLRTVIFGFIAVAAVIEFGSDAYSAPLVTLIVALTAYGILAGGSAMDDLAALREDLDDETRQSSYGKQLASRNFGALKAISGVLIGLIGVAELYAVFF